MSIMVYNQIDSVSDLGDLLPRRVAKWDNVATAWTGFCNPLAYEQCPDQETNAVCLISDKSFKANHVILFFYGCNMNVVFAN